MSVRDAEPEGAKQGQGVQCEGGRPGQSQVQEVDDTVDPGSPVREGEPDAAVAPGDKEAGTGEGGAPQEQQHPGRSEVEPAGSDAGTERQQAAEICESGWGKEEEVNSAEMSASAV